MGITGRKSTDVMRTASLRQRLVWVAGSIALAAVAAVLPHVNRHGLRDEVTEPVSLARALGVPGAPRTTPEGLGLRISEMENRLRTRPHDTDAAVLLADALLRQSRVTGEVRTIARAGDLLKSVLKDSPGQYDSLRLLAAVYLSQHKFRDALETGRRARELRPADAWNYGVIADALIELGDYEEAFAAIDAMAELRPGAGAYARVAYARELQGQLDEALEAIRMAAEATTSHDPEAQAWYASQMGELYLRMQKFDEAEREFRHASFMFPNHPSAMVGQGKVKAARGDGEGALTIYLDQIKRTPTFDLAARIGDVHAQADRFVEADRYYQLAEDLAGPAIAQTEAHLARFLADHDRKLPEAVRIAEAIAATRDDIFTNDALAWVYFKSGRLADARAAARRALRTGTRDPQILWHASHIQPATTALVVPTIRRD